MYIVVGLGNPSSEYSKTRHNTGRMAASVVAEKVSGVKVITPDTFMNKSGSFVAKHVKSKKAAEKLIVIYDDLDLSLGTMKISFNRGSGGHKGLESIIKALKTREFIRIRVGIGKKEDVEKHILGEFKKPEMEVLKKIFKSVVTAVEMIKEEGYQSVMTEFNS